VISASQIIYWSSFEHAHSGTQRIPSISSSTVWARRMLPSCLVRLSKTAKTVSRIESPVCSARRFRRTKHSAKLLPLNGESDELASNLSPSRSGAVCLKVKLSTKTKLSYGSPKRSALIRRKRVFSYR
jgi:hypothetical protein